MSSCLKPSLEVGNIVLHDGCKKIVIAVYRDKVAVVKINPCHHNVEIEFGKCKVEFIDLED